MTRIDFRPWAGLALSVAVLGYVGCSSSSPTSSSPASPAGSKSAGAGSKGSPADAAGGSDSKVLANLGNPAAVLVLTGEMDGYLEPCGCTDGQIGGLLRRYDFFERLRKQNWPVASLDLGSLTKDPAVARGGFDQAKLKFDHSVKALKLLDYSALALSAEDMKLGVNEALGLFLNNLGDKTKIVVANVPAPAGYESMFQSSMVVPAGPVKVGVTAVIDPKALEALNDPDKGHAHREAQAAQRRPAGRPGRTGTEVRLPGADGPGTARAGQKPGRGLSRLRHRRRDVGVPRSPQARSRDAQRRQDHVGHGGPQGEVRRCLRLLSRRVGAAALYLATLSTRFDGPATPMKQLIEVDYRDFLRSANVVENIPRRDYVSSVSGATFVGADNCKSCHPNTYLKWLTTKHAQAFESLAVRAPSRT